MIIATDIETYKQFDGTKTCYQFIKDNQVNPKEKYRKFEEMKKGFLYPVLNAQEYCLGIVAHEDGGKRIFYNPEDHWNYIIELHEKQKKRNGKLKVYGHNHIYDLIGYGFKHLLDKKLKIINQFPLFAMYELKTYFLDTLSFYRKPLKEVGEELGFPKKEMPEVVKTRKELIDYCMRDTEIVLKSIQELRKGLSNVGFNVRKLHTAGQVAMTSFLSYCRKNNLHWNFMKNGEIFRSKNFRKTRVALRGGRVQAFQTGKFKDCLMVDVNKLYSWAMVNLRFPKLDEYIYLDKPNLEEWKFIKETIGTIQATVKVRTDELPYLPITYESEQFYPSNCEMTGTWTIGELKRAEELGGYEIKSINWVECYEECKINPFKEFILKLYDLNLERDDLAPAIKLILNNLFGKFSQYRKNVDTLFIYRDEVMKYQNLGWKVKGTIEKYFMIQKDTGEYIAKYCNPLISALITAKAREYMYSWLVKVPKEDLLYIANDAIMFKGDNLSKFPISNKIGEFKIEKKGEAHIIGKQKYRINDKIAISGLPKRDLKEGALSMKEVPIRRMVSFRDAIARNCISKIGTFEWHNHIITDEKSKIKIVPKKWDETVDYKIIGE